MRGWVSPGCPHPLCQESAGMAGGGRADPERTPVFWVSFCEESWCRTEVSKPWKTLMELFAASSCFAQEQRSLAPAGGLARTKSSIAGCSALCRMQCQPSGREGAGGVPGKVGRAGSAPGHWECPCPSRMSSKLLPNHSGMPLSLQSSLLWNLTWGSLEKRSMSVKIKCGCCGILSLITARVAWREVWNHSWRALQGIPGWLCHLLGMEVFSAHGGGNKSQASNVTSLVSVFESLPCFSWKVDLFFCDCSFKNANKTFLLICVYWQNYCNCIKWHNWCK